MLQEVAESLEAVFHCEDLTLSLPVRLWWEASWELMVGVEVSIYPGSDLAYTVGAAIYPYEVPEATSEHDIIEKLRGTISQLIFCWNGKYIDHCQSVQ